MDREILFRGKRLDNGEWIEGFYVHLCDGKGNESHRIYTGYAETDCGDFYPDWFEVDPATVSRYTGLTDKNGVKVFKGDILRSHYDEDDPEDTAIEIVLWYNNGWCTQEAGSGTDPVECSTISFSEVIGNIHDNPELLEEAKHGLQRAD